MIRILAITIALYAVLIGLGAIIFPAIVSPAVAWLFGGSP